MANCLCCKDSLLMHVRHHEVYWFCRTCWQEMPHLDRTEISLNIASLEQQVMPMEVPHPLVLV